MIFNPINKNALKIKTRKAMRRSSFEMALSILRQFFFTKASPRAKRPTCVLCACRWGNPATSHMSVASQNLQGAL